MEMLKYTQNHKILTLKEEYGVNIFVSEMKITCKYCNNSSIGNNCQLVWWQYLFLLFLAFRAVVPNLFNLVNHLDAPVVTLRTP